MSWRETLQTGSKDVLSDPIGLTCLREHGPSLFFLRIFFLLHIVAFIYFAHADIVYKDVSVKYNTAI